MGSQWHHVQRCFKNLARFVRTVSVTLSRGCRGRYTGPQRVSLSDAMDDVAWLRERCKAQSKTQAERTHVVQLVQALSHNSSSGTRVVGPDVPAVPLDVLPALSARAEMFQEFSTIVRTVSVTLSRGCRGEYTDPQRVSLSDAMDDVACLCERCISQFKA